ncbi:unnamed protein product [Xylocopa violacea]|uniref:PiggyBac transposable element-derived protein domain-containing protein n=1 Tax=Xylocopa violacea TaxID=135666 RepID=A0ABP1P0Q5_XYLVO
MSKSSDNVTTASTTVDPNIRAILDAMQKQNERHEQGMSDIRKLLATANEENKRRAREIELLSKGMANLQMNIGSAAGTEYNSLLTDDESSASTTRQEQRNEVQETGTVSRQVPTAFLPPLPMSSANEEDNIMTTPNPTLTCKGPDKFHDFILFESVNNQLAHKIMISNEDSASSSSTDDIFLPSPSKRCRVLSDSEESSSSSLSDLMIPSSIRRRRIESDSESEFEDDGNNDENNTQEEVIQIGIFLRNLQYLPNKHHHRWGIKLWMLCYSISKYCLAFYIYRGAQSAADRLEIQQNGLAHTVVMKLLTMGNYFLKGYHIFVDNFFTSIPLAKALYDLGTYITGTIRRNRKFLPKSLNEKFGVGITKYFRQGPILTIGYREKKSQRFPVILLSSKSKAEE